MRSLLVCLVVCSACAEQQPQVQPAVVAPFPSATFAGRTSNAELFGAVVTNPDGFEAYFCDGQKDFWFRGVPGPEILELEDGRGATLLLSVETDRVVGRLVDAESTMTFDFGPVSGEILFRAETASGATPVLGGWIRLPDGEQRGLVRVGTANLNSTLNAELRAACTGCNGLALAPAPYTPAAVNQRPNTPQRFTVVALGDSMMAGEGAPVVSGNLTDNGSRGTQETWSNGRPLGSLTFNTEGAMANATLAAESKRCHRGAAGAGLAVAALQTAWPRVQFVHQSFACSGAKVGDLIDNPATVPFYSGPGGCGSLTGTARTNCLALTDDLASPVPAQLPLLSTFLSSNSLSADAVLLSVGVNDVSFSGIIADCLAGNCDASDSEARALFAAGRAALPGRYATLAAALTARQVLPTNVYISKYPNPLRRTATDLCAGTDYSDALLRLISDEEAVFANSVHGQVNTLVANGAAAAGWTVVDGHVGTEIGHGMCTSSPWFNDTQTALRTQGEDQMPQGGGLVHVSSGMVHPNAIGHRDMYAPAWRSALEATLERRFTPRTPTSFKATRFEVQPDGLVRVTLAWDDVNRFESESSLRIEGDSAGPSVIGIAADATSIVTLLRKPSSGPARATFFLKACFQGPSRLCSNETLPLEVEIAVPALPPQNAAATVDLRQTPAGIRLSWADDVPAKIFSTVEREDSAGLVTRSAVEGQGLVFSGGTDLRRFRVATCNTLGCSPPTPWVEFQRPTMSLPRQCVPPQQSRIDGCR